MAGALAAATDAFFESMVRTNDVEWEYKSRYAVRTDGRSGPPSSTEGMPAAHRRRLGIAGAGAAARVAGPQR